MSDLNHLADLNPDRQKVVAPPPPCVTCFRFVKVSDPATVRHFERGEFGELYSVEFECGRCAKRAS